jgi:hypothetical protein
MAIVLVVVTVLAGGGCGSSGKSLSIASTPGTIAAVPTTSLTAPPPTTSLTSPPPTASQFVSSEPAPVSSEKQGHFSTQPVGAGLPSDATCASEVRPAPEVRPANTAANQTRGVGANSLYPRVTGDYVGTTDEIIQWAACKWGMDEDIVRAQTAVESWWFQRTVGDFSTDSSTCVPGHQKLGADGQAGQCPQSIGILQDRYPYHRTAFATDNDAAISTAYNIDYAYASWRNCFEGGDGWLNQFSPPKPYQAGDLWGCIGVWYSGRWYDSRAATYISKVQSYLAQRIWETPDFLGAE